MSRSPRRKKSQIWFADGSASVAVICWHLTPRAFQPHLGSKDDGERKYSPGVPLEMVCNVYFTWKERWPGRRMPTVSWAVTTSFKGWWATWSVGRGMWMDISGWAPIWENHWVSITGMVKNSHCAWDSSVWAADCLACPFNVFHLTASWTKWAWFQTQRWGTGPTRTSHQGWLPAASADEFSAAVTSPKTSI